jgi:mono/diheme cytochrome c family protein
MRKSIMVAVAVVVAGLAAYWLMTAPVARSAVAPADRAADLANGRVMFFAGGCASCHATPNQDDKTRLGGGLALTSPFGTFYVPNISSDARDGIGAWSEADFIAALWSGISPDGQHYFPAFPYPSYTRMHLDDVRDLFAFLKTLPAVSGRVRDHDLPFPFGIRRNVGLWKLAFFDDERFHADQTQNADWNRGAYLVNGPGHCAECHTPRNPLGGLKALQRFAGGPAPDGKGWVPNITQKRLGSWSTGDLAYLFETGDTPDGDSVGGSMAPVIRNTSQLSAQDRTAIAIYLKSLPPIEGPSPPVKTP